MPWKAFRCVVNLTLHEVTAPGVWLASREDVYLEVSLFGQYHTTRELPPVFPLRVNERLHFEKTFYTARSIAEVEEHLNDEVVIFELVQLSDYSDGDVRLASFSSNAEPFLEPSPYRAGSMASDHEILLSRTIAFNGVSPQLSFSTQTVIKESISPERDILDDTFEEERDSFFMKTHRVPTRRTRSPVGWSPTSHSSRTVSFSPYKDQPSPHYRQPTKSSLSRCRSVSSLRNGADIDAVYASPPFVVGRPKEWLTRRMPGGDAWENCNANASKKDKKKTKKDPKESKSDSKREKISKKRDKSRWREIYNDEWRDNRSFDGGGWDQCFDDCDQGLCSEYMAYQKTTRRPCLGQGSFHRDRCVSPCRCCDRVTDHMDHRSSRCQQIHLPLPEDEDDMIYISRRRPRSASTIYRSRFARSPTRSPEPRSYHSPERVRFIPCYRRSCYTMDR